VEEAFDRLVGQGRERLARPLLPLVATGMLGGIDVGVGVLAYLVVEHDTGSALLGALAFTIGFVALLMAGSELFTENFLVPVVAVVAKDGTISQLLRLWVVSLAANLLTGLGMAAIIVYALPDVQDTAIAAGAHYAELGTTIRSFLLAVLAGAVITLLTRMQNATDNLGIKIVPAVMLSFVLVAAKLFHCVLDSILMFAGLLTAAPPTAGPPGPAPSDGQPPATSSAGSSSSPASDSSASNTASPKNATKTEKTTPRPPRTGARPYQVSHRSNVPQPSESGTTPLDCRVLQFSQEPRPAHRGDSTGAQLTARPAFAPLLDRTQETRQL
jgi:formate/nitrite transporter FocA (FNT family)